MPGGIETPQQSAERIQAELESGAAGRPSDADAAWYFNEWLGPGGLRDQANDQRRQEQRDRDQAARDRNSPAGRRARQQMAAAISQEAKNHTPAWIENSTKQLIALYKDSLILEKAYQHFIDNFDDYQPLIEQASTSMDATGGGTIATKEMAEKAIGDVVWPAGGDHESGTNWLSVKTKWRQFGLITGYNMQFQRKSVLAGAEGHRNYQHGLSEKSTEILTFIGSPRYETGVGGASEPGLSNAALENEKQYKYQSAGTEWLTPAEDDWFYGDGTPFGMDGWPRSYDPSDVPSYFGPKGDTEDPIGAHQRSSQNVTLFSKDFGYAAGQMRPNDRNVPMGTRDASTGVWISRHPFYRGAGIHFDDFFKNPPPGTGYQGSTHGHFLSPQILYYFQLIAGSRLPVNSQNLAVDPAPLIAARATLGQKGAAIVNAAASQVPGYQKLKVQEEFWSQGPFGNNTWKTYFGTGTSPYAGSQLDSWAPALTDWLENQFGGDEAQDYWSRERTSESRLLEAHGQTSGIPDKLGIYPTLPLQGIDNAAPGETQLRTFGDGYAFSGGSNRSSEVEALMTPYKNYITNAVPVQVKAAWSQMYDNFEGGTGPIFAADQAIRQVIGPITLEGPELDKAVERILDFFGAGSESEATNAQARELDVSGGGDHSSPNLENITEAARNVVTNFRSLTPFDLQCFLMENIGTITAHKERGDQSYSNLIKLRGEPGSTISQLQHGNRTSAVKEILNLTPAVYGLLEPYIKIYRVDYSKGKGAARALVQAEMPIPNFTDPDSVDVLTAPRGRVSGWGLQSFTWKLDGVQPAEVDNNISANLSFYFQSVNDLFKNSHSYNKASGDHDGPYQAGLNADRDEAGDGLGPPIVAPLDLLISAATIDTVIGNEDNDADPEAPKSPPQKCTEALKNVANQEYDGARFRIKVVAGWSTPTRKALRAVLPGKTDADLTKLIEAISATRIALYLQQVRHNLTFNQDGSVKLSIDYQAALTGILTSNHLDILGASDKAWKAKMDTLKKEIDEAKKTKETRSEALPAAALNDDSAYKSAKEELKSLLEKKKNLINEDKVQKYKRFLKNLYGTTSRGNVNESDATRIYTLVVDATEAIKVPLHKLTDAETRARRAIKRLSKDPGFTLHNNLGAASATTNLLDAIDTSIDADSAGIDADTVTKGLADQWVNNLTSRGDKIYIPYFYLGDLIDSIIENNAALGHGGDLSAMIKSSYLTFLGDMDVTNPLLLYASENSDALICADTIKDNELLSALRAKGLVFEGGVKKRINIGSIPIGLDQFNVWFKNHVVKSQRNTYYLLHFIKDLCAYLIGGALKTSCYETNVINDVRFDTSIIHFNNRGDEGNMKIRPDPLGGAAEHTVAQLATAIGATTPENDIPSYGMTKEQQDKMNLTSGLVLYCTDAKPKARNGDYDADLASGIYHHYIGAAAGLVKKISFSRVDQQYLREAKIQKHGHLGAQQLRELYSATIDMAGNTLFKNGQYTFIWPTSMVSHDKQMAQLLGLGGYFLITGVSHKISPAGYSVSVKALQEGLAFDDDPVVVAAQPTESIASLETSTGEPATAAGGSSAASELEFDAGEECQDGAVESQDGGHGTDPADTEDFDAGGTPESTEEETFADAADDYIAGIPGPADDAAGTQGAFAIEGREDELAAIYARGGNPFPDYPGGPHRGRALYRSMMEARRRAQQD